MHTALDLRLNCLEKDHFERFDFKFDRKLHGLYGNYSCFTWIKCFFYNNLLFSDI